ncbi:amidohydrolase family protein, partial [bacterium]|nr:amidohydrolase family protein [bacterium]
HGTTRVFLATVAAAKEELSKSFSLLDDFLGHCSDTARNQIAGILLEGTFVKNKAFAGAQNPKFFHSPDIDYFKELQEAAFGKIHSVNITPEFGAPALDLIEYLTDNGVVACAGHTGATAIQYEQAIEKGLKVAIHFLNGPTGGSTKPFGHGGAIQAVLRSRDVYAETITDGFHVDPIYVREVLKRKGKTRVMAITDSMFVTGMDDVDTFVVSGVQGKVSANRRYLEVAGTEDTLFGSVLTMDQAFSNIVSWLTAKMDGMWTDAFPAYTFEEAMIQATWMCSRTPAKALNIMRPETLILGQDLSPYTGSIDVGKSADILITSMTGECGNYNLNIEKVIVKGQIVN